MRCLIVVFLFLSVPFIQGCSVEPTDLSSVQAGSDQAQIETVLGEPIDVMQTTEGEVRSYEYDEGSDDLESLTPFWDGRSLGGCVGGCAMAGLLAMPFEILTYPHRRSEQIDDQIRFISVFYDQNGKMVRAIKGPEKNKTIKKLIELVELEKRAKNGDQEAQYRLALLAEHRSERLAWYKQATFLGELSSIHELVNLDSDELYKIGRLSENPEAWSFYCTAAHKGHVESRNVLGNFYRWGTKPVKKDLLRSYLWYRLAENAASSSPKNAGGWIGDVAEENRQFIEKKFSPAQLSEAERLVANWKPEFSECEFNAQ